MATNLRLRPAAVNALRAESERSGRSQQDIIREAVDRYLAPEPVSMIQETSLFAAGIARPPRSPLVPIGRRLILPAGENSADLLDRSDRF